MSMANRPPFGASEGCARQGNSPFLVRKFWLAGTLALVGGALVAAAVEMVTAHFDPGVATGPAAVTIARESVPETIPSTRAVPAWLVWQTRTVTDASPPFQGGARVASAEAFAPIALAPPDAGQPAAAQLVAGPAKETDRHNFARRFDVRDLSAARADVTAAVERTVVAPAAPPQKRIRLASLPSATGPTGAPADEGLSPRTAIYDISAQAVYLPSGEKLEAHSGLGAFKDNPRHTNVKNRGPTPVNTYRLRMRERMFHGVQAIRLLPEDESAMFRRDGILAHSYLLGPRGDSNGCVSFKDYPRFLRAFLRGEVDRLVVVAKLPQPPRFYAGNTPWPKERGDGRRLAYSGED